ncbi:MAG: hypothetical protein OEZ23_00360 [Gammaproteobacteria bacterium]|nr:hypothetical protein [Gammaproteobacteria bacterium]
MNSPEQSNNLEYWPEILAKFINDNSAKYNLYLHPELIYFSGHFSTLKLLPGIVQINWAQHFAQREFNISPSMVFSLAKAKFTSPLIPGTSTSLEIAHIPEKKKIAFEYIQNAKSSSKGTFFY